MTYAFSFKDCLAKAERINWRVDELIGPGKTLDFSKPFLPEALARTEALPFLTPAERLTLNQIRGNAYLTIFGLVEEFILPFLMDHARPDVSGESNRSRALLEFAAEEAKHIHLFRTFAAAFADGFNTRCDVIGPPDAVAKHVLSHPPLSVALLILHVEWMTQRHFTESMQDDRGMDGCFKDLLLHHWMEEQQHAQLDTLLVEEIAAGCKPEEIDAALEGYKALGAFLDGALAQQAAFDLDALQRACGRDFDEAERAQFIAAQHQANRWTYIGSGLSHPRFVETIHRLKPQASDEFAAMAEALS
ncbi:MAG TPA: hypothetical protein VIO94_08565 [Phenylobacterium sp.]